jgi:regulator of sigma E protease
MLGSILVFFVVLSILVLAHEFGHYFAAKKAGIWVEEFGFGLPPKLFGIKIGETTFSLNALPFGGFCRLHGESSEEEIIHPRKSFFNRNKRTRISVVIAGVVMNILLAIVAFGIVYSFSGIPRETNKIKIVDVTTGSPAQVGGILIGDIVKSIDKQAVSTNDEFIKLVDAKKGKKITLEIERTQQGEEIIKKITLTPRESPPVDEGPLGVVITSIELWYPPAWQRPFVGVYYGTKDALFWGKTVVLGFYDIFVKLFKGVAPKEVSGPVGIFAITTQVAKDGILSIINLIGILSINLAVLNIIPFPALDGGRLLFIGIEGVIGKKIIPKVERTINMIGMILLLVMLAIISLKDIINLIRAGSISKFVETIVK